MVYLLNQSFAMGRQLALTFSTRGGRRPGAGRKPAPGRPSVPHRRRQPHEPRCPVHVTLRATTGLPSLRAQHVFPGVRCALGDASGGSFRVLHYSVQSDHVHLLIEADVPSGFVRGVQGDSRSASRRRSIVRWGAEERSGPIGIMAGCCARHAKSGTRLSMCCRTFGNICGRSEDSIPARPRHGSPAGRRLHGPTTVVPRVRSHRRAPGSHASAGSGTDGSESTKRLAARRESA